jgi:hypothetical protein
MTMKWLTGVTWSEVAAATMAAVLMAVVGLLGAAEAADFKTEASDTVVQLHVEGAFVCSAVVVGPGVVLTAKHCLLAGEADTIVTRDGEFAITGGKISQATDGVVLYAPGVQCPCAVEDHGQPVIGDEVRLVGFPLSTFNDERGGFVFAVGTPDFLDPVAFVRENVPDEFWYTYVFYSPVGTYGDSGGGLFMLRGDKWVLIGIHTVKIDDPYMWPYEIGLASGAVPLRYIER